MGKMGVSPSPSPSSVASSRQRTVSYTHLDVYKRQVLYYLVLASGFWFTVRLSDCAALGRWAGVLLMGVGFYVACLVVFSVAAPPLPIFRS